MKVVNRCLRIQRQVYHRLAVAHLGVHCRKDRDNVLNLFQFVRTDLVSVSFQDLCNDRDEVQPRDYIRFEFLLKIDQVFVVLQLTNQRWPRGK